MRIKGIASVMCSAALLASVLLLGAAGCSCSQQPVEPVDPAVAPDSVLPDVPVIVDEVADQATSVDPQPVDPAPVEPSPVDPQPVDPAPVETAPNLDAFDVYHTGSSTLFITAHYTVEIPDGLLPEGWTSEWTPGIYMDTSYQINGEWFEDVYGWQLSFHDSEGMRLFWVSAFRNEVGQPTYQAAVTSIVLGDSAAGGGWQVAVVKGTIGFDFTSAHQYLEQVAPYVSVV